MSTARRPRLGYLLAVLIATIALSGPREARAQSVPLQLNGIDRVVVFADVHGAYNELIALLRETGMLDARDHWAAGHTHLVSLGDLLDRGADSRKVMDLLMRLQGEAQAAGGQLHVVLGNHEAMNMLGDLRYVEASEYASYGDWNRLPSARNCAKRGRRRKARAPAQSSTRNFRPDISVTAPLFRPRASTASGC